MTLSFSRYVNFYNPEHSEIQQFSKKIQLLMSSTKDFKFITTNCGGENFKTINYYTCW